MCGIVGIAGDLYFKEEKTMQSLFLLDYFRGTDSTGLAAVRTNGDVKIAKLAQDPITLFQYNKFKDALNGNSSKLFLGHNRASTSGLTNNFNAHPYQFDHITGVQNGTLETKDKTMLEDNLNEKFDVDSQALFAHIAKFGIKETIPLLQEGYESAKGAWALVWYDQKEDTLNFIRNKHRPLWLAWEKGFKRLFFASRWEFISHAGAMADKPYEWEQYERKDEPGSFYRFFRLPENQHWKFNLDEMRKGSKERPKPVAQTLAGKEPKSVSSYKTPVWDPFPKNKKDDSQTSTTRSTTTTSPLGSNRQGNGVFSVTASVEKPYAHVLGVKRFNELVQAGHQGNQVGCSFCYKDIPFGAAGITVYEDQDTILCSSCSGSDPENAATPALKLYVSGQAFSELAKAA